MKKLFCVWIMLGTSVLYSQEKAEPVNTPGGIRLEPHVAIGIGSLKSHSAVFPVYGELRGVKHLYNELPQFQVGGGLAMVYKKFRAGVNFNVGFRPFDVEVHRYKLYYSPGGNPYGGDIYYRAYGYYISMGTMVYTDYFLFENKLFGLGAGVTTTLNNIFTARYRNYSSSPKSNYDCNFNYCTVTSGPFVAFKKNSFTCYIKPHVQLVTWQQSDMFSRWGFTCLLQLNYRFTQRTTRNK